MDNFCSICEAMSDWQDHNCLDILIAAWERLNLPEFMKGDHTIEGLLEMRRKMQNLVEKFQALTDLRISAQADAVIRLQNVNDINDQIRPLVTSLRSDLIGKLEQEEQRWTIGKSAQADS